MTAIPLEDDDLEYPDSDGKPMAETDLHLEEMVYLRETFKERFADVPDVYVAGNLLFYYEKGRPKSVCAPDLFVVQGIPKGLRRTYLLWKERKAPCLVVEVTSDSTRRKDTGFKKRLYAQLGVTEYFLFDPYGDYLNPNLVGFRLTNGRYRPAQPEPDGSLVSTTTQVVFRAQGIRLRLTTSSPASPYCAERKKPRPGAKRKRPGVEPRDGRLPSPPPVVRPRSGSGLSKRSWPACAADAPNRGTFRSSRRWPPEPVMTAPALESC
ncbi:MAG TPA: Uma2 family endonuclease [Thermoanaerobaculia bacterium]